MKEQGIKIEEHKDKVEITVSILPDSSAIKKLKADLSGIIGAKDISFSFDQGLEVDFINFQFLMAVLKWQEGKGKKLIIKDLSLVDDHPVMISGGHLLV